MAGMDDKLADEIVGSFQKEQKRWKIAVGRDDSPYISWYVRDDGLRVGVGFTNKKHVAVNLGEYSASIDHKRSIDRVWKAAFGWREWLRVETLKSIAGEL